LNFSIDQRKVVHVIPLGSVVKLWCSASLKLAIDSTRQSIKTI